MSTWDQFEALKPLVDTLDAQVAELADANASLALAVEELSAENADLKAQIRKLTKSTVFGWSNDTNPGERFEQALARRDSTLGKGGIIRLYSAPGKGASVKSIADRSVAHSFKDALTDAQAEAYFTMVNQWLTDHPGLEWYWTYFHEVEDNIEKGELTAAQFRNTWLRLRAIQKRIAPRAKATLILMGWTLDPRAKRNWRDYYPPGAIDVMGWDTYSAIGNYADPATLYGPGFDVADWLALPSAVMEWGAARTAQDPDGSLRAKWIERTGAYFKSRGVEAACYWDNSTSTTNDYRLTDSASQAAMRALCNEGD